MVNWMGKLRLAILTLNDYQRYAHQICWQLEIIWFHEWTLVNNIHFLVQMFIILLYIIFFPKMTEWLLPSCWPWTVPQGQLPECDTSPIKEPHDLLGICSVGAVWISQFLNMSSEQWACTFIFHWALQIMLLVVLPTEEAGKHQHPFYIR